MLFAGGFKYNRLVGIAANAANELHNALSQCYLDEGDIALGDQEAIMGATLRRWHYWPIQSGEFLCRFLQRQGGSRR